MAAERTNKGVTFYPEPEILEWYQTLGYGQANREINRLLRFALESGAGDAQSEPDLRQNVEQLSKKLSKIEKYLPPEKIAELTITKPLHLIMGLQMCQVGKSSLRFMAWRHLNEDRELEEWANDQVTVSGSLQTEDRLIEFTGTLEKGGLARNKQGRIYPDGEITQLRIIKEQVKPHDFSSENELVALLDKFAIGPENKMAEYAKKILAAERCLFPLETSFESRTFMCIHDIPELPAYKAKLIWRPGTNVRGRIHLMNLGLKKETPLLGWFDEELKYIVDSGELAEFLRLKGLSVPGL